MTIRDTRALPGDRDLLEACRKGDPAAWERLVWKYRRLVYSIALKNGLAPEAAGDVFQSVFLSLIRSLDTLRRQETLVPWLVTTTRRQSWKALRATRATDDAIAPDALPVAATAQEDLESLESQVLVREALDRIDGRCRRLLEALFYADPAPSYADISRDQGLPVPSIGPTRIRCLEKLRRELGKDARFLRAVSKGPPRGSIRRVKDRTS